jgi:predicted AAA+ superfamily ATPase
MFELELQRKITDFRELGLPEYVPREGRIHVVDRMVSTIVGARRVGKSFRALQLADEFLEQGFIESLRQVCPVDFDNPILAGMSGSDLGLIQNTFLKLSPECGLRTPVVFILDEIHQIPGWEAYVIDLSRNRNWKVIVTGSSSKLLRDDIATGLRGKAIASTLYPLSFREFLKFRSFAHEHRSTKGRAEALRLFEEYLTWGAYPAAANLEPYSREALLRQYYETMLLKDIIQRFNVSRPQQCTQLYNHLLSNIAKPFTLKSAYEYLRGAGFTTSREAVRDYVQWAEDAWLVFAVPIYSHSSKEQERNYRKLYCIDWALAMRNSPVWNGAVSRALENMVFLHLRRTYSRVHYYLTRSKRQEVDFLALDDSGEPALAVQACLELQPDRLQRELEPLVATARYFGVKENLIVTRNEERLLREGEVSIRIVPAWRWMLEELESP